MSIQSCSEIRPALDTLAGTAPQVEAYVVIEQPKPWPRKVKDIGGTLSRLKKLVRSTRGKIKFLATPRLTWLEPSCHPRALVLVWDGQTCLSHVVPAEVEAVDEALAKEFSSGQEAYYLVCTHGSRDRCCGTFGYPVFKTLEAQNSRRVLEVSHLGGHRFAPVVVAFPEWRYFGHLTSGNCEEFDQLLASGLPYHQHYRGHGQLNKYLQTVEAELWRIHRENFRSVTVVHQDKKQILVKANLSNGVVLEYRAVVGSQSYRGIKSCQDLAKDKTKTLEIPVLQILETTIIDEEVGRLKAGKMPELT